MTPRTYALALGLRDPRLCFTLGILGSSRGPPRSYRRQQRWPVVPNSAETCQPGPGPTRPSHSYAFLLNCAEFSIAAYSMAPGEGPMDHICLALPVVEGQSDAARTFMQQLDGARRDEFDRSEQRIGITKELWYLAQLPSGDHLIGYMESADFAS